MYIQDTQGRVQGPLGVLTNSPRYNGSNKNVAVVNDWVTISWADSVRLEPNRYSGDTIVPISDVQLGETVCVYGNTAKRENCGNFAGRTGTTFYVEHATSDPGDSGGPLWIPGRGLIGVLAGADEIEYLSTFLFIRYHLQLDLIRATAPGVNGGAVSDDDIFHVAQRWNRLGRPDHIVTVSENSNLSSGDSTAEGSSDPTEDEIWGVVSGVIALISVLVGLARQFGFVR